MPAPAPKLLLAAAVLGMALLIGWVSTTRRAATRSTPLPPLARETAHAERDAKLVPPPFSVEAAPPAPAEADSSPAEGSTSSMRGRLIGFVTHSDGSPAARALVVLAKQHESTNEEGRFQLLLPPELHAADLVVHEPGYEPAWRQGYGDFLDPHGENSVRITLGPPTQDLTGRIVDVEGQGLKGWTVELDGPDLLRDLSLRENVRSDATGAFKIKDVPQGLHVVLAFKKGRELAIRSDPIVAGEIGLTIVVPRDE